MNKTTKKTRFEFLLYINKKNIICQRYFDVDNYNDSFRYSSELGTLMHELTGMKMYNGGVLGMGKIPNHLKKLSNNFLWDNYNPHKKQTKDEVFVQNIFEKPDDFQFEIKVDGKVIAVSTFSGNYFPPRVRYQVDILEIIPEIVSEIRHYININTQKYTAKNKK